MESALDRVADGKQNWERYLIDWNETYFAPALANAYQFLATDSSDSNSSTKATTSRRNPLHRRSSSGNRQPPALTEIHCPKCEWLMQKIPCRSKKLQADHFLKCSNSNCNTAMFWSEQKQGYQLSYSQQLASDRTGDRSLAASTIPKPQPAKSIQTSPVNSASSTPSKIVDYPCPVCSQPLELHEYVKDSEPKKMLRCSDASKRRQDDHKQVAYFAAKGRFWSPIYGEIAKPSTQDKSSSSNPMQQRVTNSPTASETTTKYPCPVCSQPLELYEYEKNGEQKKMLRCSDLQARRQEDHKAVDFFASKGTFWSP